MNMTEKSMKTVSELMALKASDVMTTPVTVVHVWDSIHQVAKVFAEQNISSAAVVDMDDRPLGVITKSDIARYNVERPTLTVAEKEKNVARGFHLEPEEVTIEHWMTPELFDVRPDTILPAVVKKMVKNGLHHIFVTDAGEKKIKGVITSFDVMMVMNRLLNQEA